MTAVHPAIGAAFNAAPASPRQAPSTSDFCTLRGTSSRLSDRSALVAVSRRLVGTGLLDADVLGLLVGEDGELGSQLVQVEAGDLLVQVLGENVHLRIRRK